MTEGSSAAPVSPLRAEPPTAWVRPALVATAVDTVGVLPIFLAGVLAIQLREDIGMSISSLGFVYASYFLRPPSSPPRWGPGRSGSAPTAPCGSAW